MNTPNKLTVGRVFMVPLFMAAYYLQPGEVKYIAALLFIAASLTDFFDGHLARKHHLITNFGKIMDPLADKILVTAALIMLTEGGRISAVITLIIIAREFFISGLRMIAASEGTVIAAGKTGKLKTATQMTAIILFLFFNPRNPAAFIPGWLTITAYVVLYISVILSIWSAIEYMMGYAHLFADN